MHIIDKNDNVPIFPESSLTLSLSETTRPDSLFAIPNAEDADSGRFGVQIYELVLSPGSDRFDLVMTNHSDGTVGNGCRFRSKIKIGLYVIVAKFLFRVCLIIVLENYYFRNLVNLADNKRISESKCRALNDIEKS